MGLENRCNPPAGGMGAVDNDCETEAHDLAVIPKLAERW
jgi:hypothetical protein